MPQSPVSLHALDLEPEEVEARFEWGLRRGHRRYVWPDVPIDVWRAGSDLIAEATRSVLAPADSGSGQATTLHRPDGVSSDALGVSAFTSGMGPLLGLWIEQGRLRSDPTTEALLRLHLAHARSRAQRARALLEDVGPRFRDAGITLTLLKGIHTGTAYFPEPGARPSTDVDVMVSPADYDRAARILESAGHRRVGSWRDPKRSEWVPPGGSTAVRALDLAHADNPLNLDLHAGYSRKLAGIRTLDLTPQAPEDLVSVDGLPGGLTGLTPPLLALVIATHASEDREGMKLIRMVEMILVSRASPKTFDPSALERARRMGALRFGYPLLALAERLVPGTVDATFLDAARADAPGRMVRLVDSLTPGGAQGVKGHDNADLFMAARGPVEHLARLGHLILPLVGTELSWRDIASFYKRRWLALRPRIRGGR